MKHDDHKHKNAERILKQAGYSCKIGTYAKGGAVKHDDEPEDEKLIRKMVKKKDLKKPEKKAEGGFVHGGMPKKRLDKIFRQTDKGDANTSMPFPTGKEKYARGGKVKSKGKTQVNVIIGNPGGGGAPAGPPPMMASPPPRPPMPPMAPPPGAMPPPGAGAPPAGIPMRAKGGKVPKMEFGGGGGKGRLEKIEKYGEKAKN